MVDSFLQCELRALSAVRVKPGAGQGSLLRDELEARDANRSLCPAATPAASRPCALATSVEVRSPNAKFDREALRFFRRASSPFSEADCFTPFLPFPAGNIQDAKERRSEQGIRIGCFTLNFAPSRLSPASVQNACLEPSARRGDSAKTKRRAWMSAAFIMAEGRGARLTRRPPCGSRYRRVWPLRTRDERRRNRGVRGRLEYPSCRANGGCAPW